MPHQPNVSNIRLENIVGCLRAVVTLLNDIHDGCGTPFVQAIANTSLSLVTVIQNIKRNKDECLQLTESTHGLLWTIVNLCMKSEPLGNLSPELLYHFGRFTETLHKIHTFVEAQQGGNTMKNIFRQGEMKALLKDCRTGLQNAIQEFGVEHNISLLNNIQEIKDKSDALHKELLDTIATLSEGTFSDEGSVMYQQVHGSENSSNSFCILPGHPKVFHGRESELQSLLTTLSLESPRIAILGPGGMGKTSLARAALHHPKIAARYEHRFFVAADSSSTSIELAAVIGMHLGLKTGRDLRKSVIRWFTASPGCLLILDNLETLWEPVETRGAVEDFLSLLSEVSHLALIVTMRGLERPGKVRWSRPFLAPLNPLSYDAARLTFIDIAEDFHDPAEIDALLRLTDNMPLAVDLIAHLVDSEGCFSVLQRWEMDKTSLLSTGYDKRSSLDASITISLSSPRMTALPSAKELLSLLSILPDGLSDVELGQCKLPIENIWLCKTVLLQTSLAYRNENQRLKSLAPIREHILHFYAPSPALIRPLREYFHLLLDVYQQFSGAQGSQVVDEIDSNRGNLQQILMLGLHRENPDLPDIIYSTLAFNAFIRLTGNVYLTLMDYIPKDLPRSCDSRLRVQLSIETLKSNGYRTVRNPESIISEGISYLQNVDDLSLHSRFYQAAGHYYVSYQGNLTTAMEFYTKALILANSCKDTREHSVTLTHMASLEGRLGNHSKGQVHARDAQKFAKFSGNIYDEARALFHEGSCFEVLSDYKNSILSIQRAKSLIALCGMSRGPLSYMIRATEAEVHLTKSEYAEARAIYNEILHETQEAKDSYMYASALLTIAEIDAFVGAPEAEVEEYLEEAKAIFESFGSQSVVFCDAVSADLSLSSGHMVTAEKRFSQCISSSWRKVDTAVFYCLEGLADVGRWRNREVGWSLRWTVVYLAYAHISHRRLGVHKALQFLGELFLLEGDESVASSLFTTSLQGFTCMDIHRSRAQCMLRLGDLAKKQGKLLEASDYWKEALPLFKRSLQKKDTARIETRLTLLSQLS